MIINELGSLDPMRLIVARLKWF